MKQEKSCGAVIIEDGKVLLVYQHNGLWSFPKGHIEPGETEAETAEREVEEETGLDIELDTSRRYEFSYDLKDINVHKTVVLFPAKLVGERELSLQAEEIKESKWVPFTEVEETLTFIGWRKIWKQIYADLSNS